MNISDIVGAVAGLLLMFSFSFCEMWICRFGGYRVLSRVNWPLFEKNWIFGGFQTAKQPNHVIHKTGKKNHKMKNTLTKVILL